MNIFQHLVRRFAWLLPFFLLLAPALVQAAPTYLNGAISAGSTNGMGYNCSSTAISVSNNTATMSCTESGQGTINPAGSFDITITNNGSTVTSPHLGCNTGPGGYSCSTANSVSVGGTLFNLNLSVSDNSGGLSATAIGTATPQPTNGVCAATHYNCSVGTSANNVNGVTSYTWTCNGLYGGTNASCSEAEPSSGTISATPTTCTIPIGSGTCSSSISWSTTNTPNATVYVGTSAFAGGTSGTANAPWIQTTPLTFTLKDNVGKTLASVNVVGQCASGSSWNGSICAAPVTATLTASPNPVAYNGRSTLTWSSSGATSCTAGGPWSNSGTLSGSGLTNPLTSNTTFTFQCTGPGGTSPLQSVTVGVNPLNGTCGSANGVAYPYGSSSYSPYTQCSSGTSNNTAFPTQGTSVSWTCMGANGGSNSPTCSASQNVHPNPSISLSPTNTTITLGQSVNYTVSSSDVVPDMTMDTVNWIAPGQSQWNWQNSSYGATVTPGNGYTSFPATNTKTTTYSFTPTIAGTYTILAGVLDNNGTRWTTTPNYTLTVNAAPTGTISASPNPCTITAGSSTCSSSISWSTANTPSATVTINNGSQTFASGTSGTQTASWIPNGSVLFTLNDSNGVALSSVNVTGVCASGSSWNGSICAAPVTATLTASPNPVAYNGRSTLTWSSSGATSCTAGGPWSNSGTLSGSGLTNPLTSNTTFTFQCTGPGGTSPLQSVTVGVNAPINNANCTNLSAPTSVSAGGSFTGSVTMYNNGDKTWTTALNYNLGSQSPQDNTTWGTGRVGLPGSVSVSPGSSAVFSRAFTAPTTAGSYPFAWRMVQDGVEWFGQTCSENITVVSPPTISFSASPSTINSGQSSTLSWLASNATSCTSAGGFSTGNATSGTASTGALSTTSTYQITCTGAGGSTSANTTVTVLQPTSSISLSTSRVRIGNTVTLSWSSANTTNCSVSGPGVSSTSSSGSQSVTINSQSTYTISCNALAPKSVTVNVVPSFQEF